MPSVLTPVSRRTGKRKIARDARSCSAATTAPSIGEADDVKVRTLVRLSWKQQQSCRDLAGRKACAPGQLCQVPDAGTRLTAGPWRSLGQVDGELPGLLSLGENIDV